MILHCHIFKNGGTTIDNILERNFGVSAIKLESSRRDFLSSGQIIDTVHQQSPSSISSHTLGLPVPDSDSITFIPLIMIRHPLDRLGSMYAYFKQKTKNLNNSKFYPLAKQRPFKEFVKILLKSGIDSSFVNLQSQFFLGNYNPPKYLSEKSWDLVVENTQSTCIGVLDRFDDSMVLWEDRLKKNFPNISLAYSKANVSHGRTQNISERLNDMKNELGSELVAEFEKRNKFDYRLYHLALKRIDFEIGNVPDFINRKLDLRQRSKDLTAAIVRKSPTLHDEHKRHTRAASQTKNKLNTIKVDKYLLSKIVLDRDTVPSRPVHIVGCGMFDFISGESLTIAHHDQKIAVVVAVEAEERIEQPIVGITVKNNANDIMFAMNSFFSKEKIAPPEIGKLSTYIFTFKIPPLNSGLYSITPAVANGTQEDHSPLNWIEDAIIFAVPSMLPQRLPGVLYVDDFKLINIPMT